MDVRRLWLAIRLAVLCYGAGLLVLMAWPFLQREVAPHFPLWVAPVTGQLAYWGIFFTLGAMTLKVLPSYHRVRIAGDFIGTGAFILNLMVQKNSGNVALEVGLTLLSGWSLWANKAHHQPITASRRQWAKALAILAGCYAFGLLVTAMWPVNAETQYQGRYWEYIALAGALAFFVSIVALETRVVRGDQWLYPLIYGVGAVLLTASYLGQYNQAGLTLNASLAALTYAPLLWKAAVRFLGHKRKERQAAALSAA